MHGHGHGQVDVASVRVGHRARAALLAVLAMAAVATVVGLVIQWPDSGALHRVQAASPYAAAGVTFPDARVSEVLPLCADPDDAGGGAGSSGGDDATCGAIRVEVDNGVSAGTTVTVPVAAEVTASGLGPGDTVQLIRNPPRDAQPAGFSYLTTKRGVPLIWLAVAFALLVVLVARLRGLMALVSVAVGGLTLWSFTLPALLTGGSGTWVALISASAIMFVVLYATHGPSLRTSVALAGTLAGVGVTALLGLLTIGTAHLTGVPDETGGYLTAAAGSLDFQGLLACAIVIAGLGVLNDVTVTQASAVWELRAAAPTSSRRQVFAGALRIGRDHVASTIYTVVFAYAGAGLATLLLLAVYDRPFLELLSTEELAEEVARILTSGIGLVLAMPLTTAIAVLVATPSRGDVALAHPSAAPGQSSGGGRRRAVPRRRAPWRRSPDWDLEQDR